MKPWTSLGAGVTWSRQTRSAARPRSYSFFSSRGNGSGRYFTGNGRPSTPAQPAAQQPLQSSVKTSTSSDKPEEQKKEAADKSPKRSKPAIKATHLATTKPLSHPTLSPRDMFIHQLFALHRPLLSLPLRGTLSTDPSIKSGHRTLYYTGEGEAEDVEDEAHTTALQLGHSIMSTTITSNLAFHKSMARLGLPDAVNMEAAVAKELRDGGILLDSTKRKKRKKMTKHKLKKRRRVSTIESITVEC